MAASRSREMESVVDFNRITLMAPAGTSSTAEYNRLSDSSDSSQLISGGRAVQHPERRPMQQLDISQKFENPAFGVSLIIVGSILTAIAISFFIAVLSKQDTVTSNGMSYMSMGIASTCIGISIAGIWNYWKFRSECSKRSDWEYLTQSAHDIEVQLLRFLLVVCAATGIVVEIHIGVKHKEIQSRNRECHENLSFADVIVHATLWIGAFISMTVCLCVSLSQPYIDFLRRHKGRRLKVLQYVLAALFWIMIIDTTLVFYVLPETKVFLPLHGDATIESTVIFTFYPLLAAFNIHVFLAIGLAFVLLRKSPHESWHPVWILDYAGPVTKLKRFLQLRCSISWAVLAWFIILLAVAPFIPLDILHKEHTHIVPSLLLVFQLFATSLKVYLARSVGHFNREKVGKSQEIRILFVAMVFFVILNSATLLSICFGGKSDVDSSVLLRILFRSFELLGVPAQAALEMCFLDSSYTRDALHSQYDRYRFRRRKWAARLFCLSAFCNFAQYFLSLILEAEHLKYDVALPKNCLGDSSTEAFLPDMFSESVTAESEVPDPLFGHLWYIIEVACVPWVVEVYLILAMLSITNAERIRRLRTLEKPMWNLRKEYLIDACNRNGETRLMLTSENVELPDMKCHFHELEKYALRTTNCKQLMHCDIVPLLEDIKGAVPESSNALPDERKPYDAICKILCILSRYKKARSVVVSIGFFDFMLGKYSQVVDRLERLSNINLQPDVEGRLEDNIEDSSSDDKYEYYIYMFCRICGFFWMHAADEDYSEMVMTAFDERRADSLKSYFASSNLLDYEAVSGLMYEIAKRRGGFFGSNESAHNMFEVARKRVDIICERREGTARELENQLGLMNIMLDTLNPERGNQAGNGLLGECSRSTLAKCAAKSFFSEVGDAGSRKQAARFFGTLAKDPNTWVSKREVENLFRQILRSLDSDPHETQMEILLALSEVVSIEALRVEKGVERVHSGAGPSNCGHDGKDKLENLLILMPPLCRALLKKLPHSEPGFKRLSAALVHGAMVLESSSPGLNHNPKWFHTWLPRRWFSRDSLRSILLQELSVWIQMARLDEEDGSDNAKRILCNCVYYLDFWKIVSTADVLTLVPVICPEEHRSNVSEDCGEMSIVSTSDIARRQIRGRNTGVAQQSLGESSGTVAGSGLYGNVSDVHRAIEEAPTAFAEHLTPIHLMEIVAILLKKMDKKLIDKPAVLALTVAYFKLISIQGDDCIRFDIFSCILRLYDQLDDVFQLYFGLVVRELLPFREFWLNYKADEADNRKLWYALSGILHGSQLEEFPKRVLPDYPIGASSYSPDPGVDLKGRVKKFIRYYNEHSVEVVNEGVRRHRRDNLFD